MRHGILRGLAAAALLLVPPAVGLAAQGAMRTEWPRTTPAKVGLNVAVLDSIDAEIRSGRYGYIDRMLVIRHGQVAYDKQYPVDYDAAYGALAKVPGQLNAHDPTSPYNYYNSWWHPYYRRGDLHTLQSVTKTVSSVIIGTAVMRGDFPSIDAPVLSFFDTTKVANIDDRKRRMTVRHLLSMTGGFDWNESIPYTDPRNTATALEESPDWIRFTIDRPMMREPGTQFNYSSGESALLAHIFRQATGQDIEEYGAAHLFRPLGISRWFWKRTPSGTADTEGGLYLEASDLARIWQLFLQQGMWRGERVVTSDWVRQSVTPVVATGTAPTASRYGLKWWLHPDPLDPAKYLWAGSGFGGQFPVAFPDLDMVVVFNAWNIAGGKQLPSRVVMGRIAHAVTAK